MQQNKMCPQCHSTSYKQISDVVYICESCHVSFVDLEHLRARLNYSSISEYRRAIRNMREKNRKISDFTESI